MRPISLFLLLLFACSQPPGQEVPNTTEVQVPQTALRSLPPKDYTAPYTQVKQLISDSAMVVAGHPLAAEVGREVLRQGGNAIDAMVAVHFMLAVVFQRAGNIGGGGFLV